MIFDSNENSIRKMAQLSHLLSIKSFGKFNENERFLQYSFTKNGILYSTDGSILAGIKYKKLIPNGKYELKENSVYVFEEFYKNDALVSFYFQTPSKIKVEKNDRINKIISLNENDFDVINLRKVENWLSLNKKELASFYMNFIKECFKDGCTVKFSKDKNQINIENDYVILIFLSNPFQ